MTLVDDIDKVEKMYQLIIEGKTASSKISQVTYNV